MKKRALVSVSDKSGVVQFCKELVELGYEIISTGNTSKILSQNNIANINISDITHFPECLDGRVKTLHPVVHAGLLAMRSNAEHMQFLQDNNINTIDLVAVNLYPFKQTITKENVAFEEAVENIDIGGPTMLRSAAKNYLDVLVLCEPDDYDECIRRLKSGEVDTAYRKLLMYKVYQHTAVYDSLISQYLRQQLDIRYPKFLTLAYEKKQDLRYGENPHQSAGFYADCILPSHSLANAEQLWGKELSFNNINDAAGALDILSEFDGCACVGVKHSNPCGVALGEDVYTAYTRCYKCDPVSIFGGIVAFNKTVDAKTAGELVKIFLEIVIAPDFDEDALKILKTKPSLRVLRLPQIRTKANYTGAFDLKKPYGGLLVQDKDASLYDESELKVVTKLKPTPEQMKQLEFAFRVVKHTKSNGIVLAKDFMAVGIGGGQTNRIWATQQAIEHAGQNAEGAVLASDAFFPFGDCVTAAAQAKITAIIQPGGSIRDSESIELCDKHGIAMVFTGVRHFKH